MFSPKGFTLLLCQNGGFGGQIYLQGDGWQVREEATRDLPDLELFKQLVISSFFVKVKVVLSTLANILFSCSVLEKAGMAKDLGRYVL